MGLNDNEQRFNGNNSSSLPFYCRPDGTIYKRYIFAAIFTLNFLFLFYNWGMDLITEPFIFFYYVLLQSWIPEALFLWLVWQFAIQDKTKNPLSKFGVLFAASLAFNIAFDVIWLGMPIQVIFNPRWLISVTLVDGIVFGAAAFIEKQTLENSSRQESNVLDDWFKRK